MARPPDQPHRQPGPPAERRRRHLERSWRRDCDIDPMILRARQLRRQGSLPQAVSVEQELLPLF
ncbi:hypothetical protein [Cyanobium sp. CH-040]|uniref:hypothetical protein n=1 Tax=Cyanobium sp. CH-040 TaxID=2823708 RepID=UPI0020CF2F18|nr:hypothetical protein [Cyanobium sp. CH-040]MCP9927934.1 hypothetical protein [Cyanobium sp. CH-040]